ncbi:single-stranded DNA-binding protein [Clostridium perfringens]|uniref:single-stranded DNA-binding protein n=1 Tax=Clostridium perfringens TaxID=1502 RepID=UPI00096A6BE7|nr:single-stranded DNA-binding protein [Clostridium perfringens]
MNVAVLIGRLTKDVELRFAAGSGTAVARFTLAVPRQFKKDECDFISCIAFGKTGETIAQYVTKGRQLAIKGNIRTGSYEAQDGTRRYTTDVVVEGFDFIDGNKNNNSSSDENPNNFLMEEMGGDNGDIPF